MNPLLSIVFQIVATVVSVVTVVWRVQSRMNDRHEREMAALEKRMEHFEEIRQKGDRDLHERINEMERGFQKEINERLSRIEGEIKGLSNISRIMNDWLVKNGGKVK